MAVTAAVVLAAYCATAWLDRPTIPRGLLPRVYRVAAAVGSKPSALLFSPRGRRGNRLRALAEPASSRGASSGGAAREGYG